jgi:hypothetical protein
VIPVVLFIIAILLIIIVLGIPIYQHRKQESKRRAKIVNAILLPVDQERLLKREVWAGMSAEYLDLSQGKPKYVEDAGNGMSRWWYFNRRRNGRNVYAVLKNEVVLEWYEEDGASL